MQKVAKKLASVKALGYTYTREFNYPSEDYLSRSTSASYLELSPLEGNLGFRYQFVDDEYIAVYNGSERFTAIKKKKTIMVQNNPTIESFDGFSYFYNSPLTLKIVLPKLIADTRIPKKLTTATVEGRRVYRIELPLQKTSITPLGEIRETRGDRMSTYRLTIDAATYLPTEVLVTNDKNSDFMKTTFANLTEKPQKPSDLSWYFSSYTNEYKLDQQVAKKLIEVGQPPPNFVLKEFEAQSQISLEKYKGKVVLLEFWIAHCGFCIAAVPKLNAIAEAYKGTDLELISINVHDPAATIASFKKRNNPAYPILIDGETTGDAYGVDGYPAIVLIGKDGKIAYASLGLFDKELDTAIKASLAK